jgi:hypothetical protein
MSFDGVVSLYLDANEMDEREYCEWLHSEEIIRLTQAGEWLWELNW